MRYIQFNQIVRDAEIANVISSVVREHHLTEGEIEKALLELPRIRFRVSATMNPRFTWIRRSAHSRKHRNSRRTVLSEGSEVLL
jgi:hypothetical protein